MTTKELIHYLQTNYKPQAEVIVNNAAITDCMYLNSFDLEINENPTKDYFVLCTT